MRRLKVTATTPKTGVDVTLIRWMLSLTPTERLQVLQQHIQSVRKLLDENPRS